MNSNIEVHDVRFCLGQDIEDCYDDLRENWWGTPESLHLDCWGILDYADGYNVTISENRANGSQDKLYFMNLGGYKKDCFAELHENVFVVAETESKARVKCLSGLDKEWVDTHVDVQMDVDSVLCISDHILEGKYHIHLVKTHTSKPLNFLCRYTPIKL